MTEGGGEAACRIGISGWILLLLLDTEEPRRGRRLIEGMFCGTWIGGRALNASRGSETACAIR